MNKALTLLCFLCCFLMSCQTPYKKPPMNPPSDDADIKIAEAAQSVSDSLIEMARIEKNIMPPAHDNCLTIPLSGPLLTRATVDWSGPIEELVARVAKSANYRLRVLGNSPSIPVLINITAKQERLSDILRNIDYQAGQKAFIHVYPNAQVVELRYAKLYS